MKDTPHSVLAGLQGWQGASFRRLKGGLSNQTWLVEADGRKAVLKIDERARSAPFNSRKAEAQIQTRAAEQGLANRVLFVTDTAYMTEYVEGDVWRKSCLDRYENLDALAKTLRALHALPLTGRTFDAVGAARDYASRIEAADAAKVSDCLQKIESMPGPQSLCCCHNDLVAENIITTPELHLLDWEYACDNDPLFDLATIVAHHGLSPDRAEYLLDAYFNGNGRQWRAQLTQQAELYGALLYLWTESRS